MSGEAMKVLPPKTKGARQGCLQMSVKTIRWFVDSPGQVIVFTSWWGDESKYKFYPKDESGDTRSLTQNKSYVFNICSSKEHFLMYLQYLKRLKFMVVKQKVLLGVGVLENLTQMLYDIHYDDYVGIYNQESKLIADIHVCFNLRFFDANLPHNLIRDVESYEDDLHPRRAISYYSQAEKPTVESSLKISELVPRTPVYGHKDISEKMLQLLRGGKENVSLLDVSNLCATNENEKTNCELSPPSSLSSILSSTSLKNFLAESTSQCVKNYVTGKDTSSENELKILEFLKNIPYSLSSNLLDPAVPDISEKQALDDLSPRKGVPPAPSVYCPEREFQNSSQWSHKRSSPVKTHSTSRFSASTNSNTNVNSKTQGSPPTRIKLVSESPSKSSGISSKINFYRISLDRIIFNSDGLKKLHGCGIAKSHQENNCPHGKYIIQYQLSKIDPKFMLEKSGPIRHVSKKILANGVIFGENDVYKVQDLRSDDVVTGFKISVQFLNQRLPMILGETESLIINETAKHSLFIKSLNGLTIGKLDVQVDVASSIDTLPPPETFSEMCREEIDELIPSSSFEDFRAKSNHSKYLTLKAHCRNSSNEKLKNVPSAQYNSFLDSYSSLSKDLSESAVPVGLDFNSLRIQPSSDVSSNPSCSTSEEFNKATRETDLCEDLKKSVNNIKTRVDNKKGEGVMAKSSNGRAVLKELTNAAPLKYAIVTHEFYVKVKNLDHCEESLVNYVFPEGTADESGRVTSKWAVASILTNLSRPFFISLPYGIPLKKFLTRIGKKSITFFFKNPYHQKTIAKAMLDFSELHTLERLFKSSHQKFITQTISIPLVALNEECTSSTAVIYIEYCNRTCKYASVGDGIDTADRQLNIKSAYDSNLNDYLQSNIDRTKTTGQETVQREKIQEDAVAKILNTTFCISKKETDCAINPHSEKPESKSADEPLILKGGGESTKTQVCDLTTEYSEPNKDPPKESYLTQSADNPTAKTQDVFYPNKEFLVDDLQSLSQLKLTETDCRLKCQNETQEVNLSSKPVLKTSSHPAPTNTHSENNQTRYTPQNSVPNTNLALGDEFNFDKIETKHANFEAMAQDPSNANSGCVNNKETIQDSFIVPNSTPAFSDEQIYPSNVATRTESDQFVSSESSNATSSDSGIRTKDGVFENYIDLPKSDFFEMGPVLPDRENDAVPSNDSGQNIADESNMSGTCLTPISISDDSVQSVDLSIRRRNSDSGYLGVSTKESFEPSISKATRNLFSSQPTIYPPQKVIPPIDDFGTTLRNKSQDRCFLARIGIVRSINIPMIRLKGTKELTQPSTYVTFNDCFKRLHSSGTVVNCLIPEYDSRHKAWLSTELLKDAEERLTFQVWCKRYENEWAGPDCQRDRCLGFVHCDLSVLMHNFRFAGGWHQIVSPSGKNNGFIQILVKPLQSIDFVRKLPCEELVYNQRQMINHLQPYNYYLNACNLNQDDGISCKQVLSQNITELEKTIQELQISHENRQIKLEERKNVTKNPPDDIGSEQVLVDKNLDNSGKSCNEELSKPSCNSKEDSRKISTPVTSKKTPRKFARFLSFRRKSRKHKSFPLSEDDSGSLSSGSVVESENAKSTKRNNAKNVRIPVLNLESPSPTVETSDTEVKNVKTSPSGFARSFSFKLKKSRKNKGSKNALLQTLPLYDNNLDKAEKPTDSRNSNRNFYISKANALYHSL